MGGFPRGFIGLVAEVVLGRKFGSPMPCGKRLEQCDGYVRTLVEGNPLALDFNDFVRFGIESDAHVGVVSHDADVFAEEVDLRRIRPDGVALVTHIGGIERGTHVGDVGLARRLVHQVCTLELLLHQAGERGGGEGDVEGMACRVEVVRFVVEPSFHAEREDADTDIHLFALDERVVDFPLEGSERFDVGLKTDLASGTHDAFGQVADVDRLFVVYTGTIIDGTIEVCLLAEA